MRTELREGIAYVWGFAPVRTLLLVMGTLSLTGMPALMVLMPVFGAHFGGKAHGAETFGVLGAASGLGAVTGAISLAGRRSVLGLGKLIAVAVAVFGLALIAFSQSHVLWLSLLIVPFCGWGTITNFAAANTILQTLVEDDLRGRVMSFFGMAFLGMTPFGVLLCGWLAKRLTPAGADPVVGASRTLLAMGGIVVIAGLLYVRQYRGMRELIRPVYIQRGILPSVVPAVAVGLETADELPMVGAP